MLPTDGEWYTVGQAARELGLTPSTMRTLIAQGRIAARLVTPRLNVISAQEVERYRREHLGRQGWDKRRAPGYRPSKMAAWARQYRVRRKAWRLADEAPAEE